MKMHDLWTDLQMYRPTDGPTHGWTDPYIEMRIGI